MNPINFINFPDINEIDGGSWGYITSLEYTHRVNEYHIFSFFLCPLEILLEYDVDIVFLL